MIEELNINESFEEKVDLNEVFAKAVINMDEELPKPPVALSMGTYFYGGHPYYIPFGSYGNFSCLAGESKSRKTFFKSALIAGYIGGQAQNYFTDIRGHGTEGKWVLDIDTEQSEFHTQRVARRVVEMVGADYPKYKAFSLRQFDTKVIFDFIEYLVMDVYKDQVGLIAIDGAADLLDSVNELEQANKIVRSLMRWTAEANCHLLTIIHLNPGSNKPTGHLGSAIMRKAETVAFVKKEEFSTIVTPNYCRNYPFEPIKFTVDSKTHLPIQETEEDYKDF